MKTELKLEWSYTAIGSAKQQLKVMQSALQILELGESRHLPEAIQAETELAFAITQLIKRISSWSKDRDAYEAKQSKRGASK